MQRRTLMLTAAAAIAGGRFARAADPVKVACVLELSGSGAGVGDYNRKGLELGIKEINDAGGILGRPIAPTFYDTQTNPGVARAQVQKALDDEPYVLIGPTYSGLVKAALPIAQRAEIPQITGGSAPDITEQGDPFVFRTNPSQKTTIPKLAEYMQTQIHAQRIALLWTADEFGKAGHDIFKPEAERRKLNIVADISTENGQVDFAADVVKAKSANADVCFLYMHEEEIARFLREAKKQGLSAAMVGEATIMNPKVLELAGDAGVGARGFVVFSGAAPAKTLQDTAEKFRRVYNIEPDHNAFQGYLQPTIIKAITEKIGKFDPKAFADAMHGGTIDAAQYPGILLTTSWDKNGDLDREAFLGEVAPGNQVKIIATLPRSGH